MKNIIISSIPTKDLLFISFSSLLGAIIFGTVFGLIGLLFADYLGFPLTLGGEQFMMEASMIFYSTITIPIGAYMGGLKTAKTLSYIPKTLYHILISFVLIACGLLYRDYASVSMFFIFAIISALLCTIVIGFSAKKSQDSPMIN